VTDAEDNPYRTPWWLPALLAFAFAFAGAAARCEEPSWSLKASPRLGLYPLTVRFTLRGENPGPELYCPAVTWTWPDGTRSSHEGDCPPWEELDDESRAMAVIETKVRTFGPGVSEVQVLVKQGKKEVRLSERVEALGGQE
jgi:hypothetical protein